MRNKLLDLHLVVLGGLATLALAPLAMLRHASALLPAPLMGALTVLAALVGVVALAAPGYAATAACFPRATLGVAKRLAYSLGFGFTLIVLGGLALNLTPWGLTYTSWSLFLGAVTLLTGAVALLRGDGRALSLQPLTRWALPAARTQLPQRLVAGALIIVALLGVGGAIALSTAGANQAAQAEQAAVGASLWMQPLAHTGSTAQVQVGVRNLSASETPFRLTLTLNGHVIRVWSALTLTANQTWTATIPVASLTTGAVSGAVSGDEQLTATLALAHTPTTTYRQVTVWVSLPNSAHTPSQTATNAGATRRLAAPAVRP